MSHILDEINTDEFRARSSSSKSERSKDFFAMAVKASPELSKSFLDADEDGRKNLLGMFRQGLHKQAPESFSTKRTLTRTKAQNAPLGVTISLPDVEVEEEVDLPILDTQTESLIEKINTGEFTSINALGGQSGGETDFMDLVAFTPKGKIDQFGEFIKGVNGLQAAGFIDKDKSEAFVKFGEQILTARGGRPRPATFGTAAAEKFLQLDSIKNLVIQKIGEPVARLEGFVSGESKEETEALIEGTRKGMQTFSPLELAVRGEGIETARTIGTVASAITLGGVGTSALASLGMSAKSTLFSVAGLEGGIGFTVGRQGLPSLAGEIFDVEPDSFLADALNTIEGAALAGLGSLLPRAGRETLKDAFAEIFGDLEIAKGLINGKSIDNVALRNDAQIIADRFGIKPEEAQKFVDELFGNQFKPIMQRSEAILQEQKVLAPRDRLTKVEALAGKRLINEDDRIAGVEKKAQVEAEAGQFKDKLAREEQLGDVGVQRVNEEQIAQRVETEGVEGPVEAARRQKQKDLDEVFAQPPAVRAEAQADIGQGKLKKKLKAEDQKAKREAIKSNVDNVNNTEVNTIVKIEDELTPIDIALNRARLPKALPVGAKSRRAIRVEELNNDFKANKGDAKIKLEEKRADIRNLFNKSPINELKANKINKVNDNPHFTIGEKERLTRVAGKDRAVFNKNIDDVINAKQADEAIPDNIKAELEQARLTLKAENASGVTKDMMRTAQAQELIASNLDEISKLNKAEINLLLNEPFKNVKNAPKRAILDRFEIERQKAVIEEAKKIPVKPKGADFDPEVAIKEAQDIESVQTDLDFSPSRETIKRFDKELADPSNPNIPNSEAQAGDIPKTQEKDGPSIQAQEASERIQARLSKQFIGDKSSNFFSAENFRDLTITAADLMRRGINKYAPWAKEMVKKFGDPVKLFLGDIWESAKRFINKPKKKIVNAGQAFDEKFGISKAANERLSVVIARQRAIKAFDNLTSPIQTRMKRIAPRVAGVLQENELRTRQRVIESLGHFEQFFKGMKQLKLSSFTDRSNYRQLDNILQNGDITSALDFIKGLKVSDAIKTDLIDGLTRVRSHLDELELRARAVGIDIGHIEDYIPRLVKDYNGFLKSRGLEQRSIIQNLIIKEEKRLGYPLTLAQEAEVANRFLQRDALSGVKTSAEKKRVIDKISEEDSVFYNETTESLFNYATKMNDRIEKQRLFGGADNTSLAKRTRTETITFEDGTKDKRVIDMPPIHVDFDEESIGAMVAKHSKGLSPEEVNEMVSMIQSRFIAGEMNANAIVQFMKNAGYILTMGKFTNSITQFGDLWLAMRKNPAEFFPGMKQASFLGDDDALRTIDLGIDRVLEEFADNPAITAKLLDKLFFSTGLKHIDKFGKETFMNSVLLKFQKTAQGKKGTNALEKMRASHAELFGDEFADKLIEDLKSSTRSYETDAAVFNALTEVQPITKLEMPQAYLNNPNGRIFYMLKTYGLKQLDQLRREGLDELMDATGDLKNGVPKEEVGKKSFNALTKIALIGLGGPLFEATTADIMKDAFRGKPVTADSISDAAWANGFRFFFLNKHVMQNFSKTRDPLMKTAQAFFPPIISISDKGIHDAMKALDGDLSFQTAESTIMLPWLGDKFFWNSDKGKERIEENRKENLKKNSFLFQGQDDIKDKDRKENKERRASVDLHMKALDDLYTDQQRFRYLQTLAVQDKVQANKVMKKFQKNRIEQRSNMTEEELLFSRESSSFKATRLAQIINGLPGKKAKKKFLANLQAKGMLTRPVIVKLKPLLQN